MRKRPVEVGISNWERSEVVKGVVAGELVAASLNEKGLDDGVLVQVVSVESGKEPR